MIPASIRNALADRYPVFFHYEALRIARDRIHLARLLNLVPCTGDHEVTLPCPTCGAAI